MRCGMVPETAKHVLFECNDAHYTEEDFLKCLGLHEEQQSLIVKKSKRILEGWEKETR